MSSIHNPGRVAGLLYLVLITIGPLFLIYIPNKLFVRGNAAATVSYPARWRERASGRRDRRQPNGPKSCLYRTTGTA